MKKSVLTYILLFVSFSAFAQQLQPVELKGIVTDAETAEILEGVNVFVKARPNIGTMTDKYGKFSLKATAGDVIMISLVGYANYEYIALSSAADMDVRLRYSIEEMESVVVTGMGSVQRKVSIVGAISNVDVAELQTPATSIANMLGGRAPGVIARLNSGEPGSNISDFWIRGIGTFGGGNNPLVLIDNIEGSLNNIDPADIESFVILKDASATAVYGTRGANGVILITTKRGFSDKLQIVGRVNMKVSYLPRTPEYLGAYDYAVLANEARVVRGNNPLYSDEELYIFKHHLDPDLYPDVNWRDEIINPLAFQETYYASARGGTTNARYFISLGASNEGTVYKQADDSKYKDRTGFGKYTYRANVDMNITESTEVRFSLDGEYTKRTAPGMDNTRILWYQQLRLTPVLMPTRYSNGKLPAFSSDDYDYSPYVLLNHTGLATYENNTNRINLEGRQDLSSILKGLKLRALGSLELFGYKSERRYVRPELWRVGKRERTVDGELVMVRAAEKQSLQYYTGQDQSTKLYFESALTYDTDINGRHRVGGLLYYNMSHAKYTYSGNDNSLNALPYKDQKFSGRFTYSLDDTYFVEANFGYTGSANFQKGRRFGFFPSMGAGWIPTKYEFVKDNVKWLSFFKIRATYGFVGNSELGSGRFPYLTKINENAGTTWGYGRAGISEDQIGADNLRWESSRKTDLGLEIKLFDDKVDMVFDWWNDQRDGIFQQRAQIPDYVGLTNMPYGNVGRMKSWGGEGNFSYHLKFNKDMRLVLRANYTYWSNLIQNYEKVTQAYPYFEDTGWPTGIQRGYVYLGLFKDEADIANSPYQDTGSKVMPGDLKYKDVNGDGVVNDDDKVPLSYGDTPRLQYGFGFEFVYKKMSLGVRFVGTGRTDFFYTKNVREFGDVFGDSWGLGYIPFERQEYGNVLSIFKDQSLRWTPASYSGSTATENPNAMFPRLSYGDNHNNNKISDYWRGDSRYLRLSEITLNYNLKTRAFAAIGLNSIDFSLVANNLYVWDKIFNRIFDPEQARFMGQQYPIPSSIVLQAYIHF